ncbi:MAG: STAS domain-containing protein [Anaerolineales bacterium]
MAFYLFSHIISIGLNTKYIIFPNGIILWCLVNESLCKGNTVMEATVTAMDNCDLVELKGRIDSFTAPQLSDTLTEITHQNIYKIILDMSDVSYVSSAGFRVLIDIQRTCKKLDQGEVILINIPKRVYETLELAGFVPLFKFFNNVSSAIAAF